MLSKFLTRPSRWLIRSTFLPALGTPASGVLSGCTAYPVATTSRTGATPQATAPAAGLLSVLAIGNGETVRTDQALFDTTNPAAIGSVGPGTAVVAARRDHIHANPAIDTLAAATDIMTLDVSTIAHGLAPKAVAPAAGWNVYAIANGETAITGKTIAAPAVTLFDDASVAAMVDTLGGASSVGTGGLARATAPTFTTSVALGGATDLLAMRYGVIGYKKLIDVNDDLSDNAITMLSSRYIVDKIVVENASISLTTATAGVFPEAAGAGTALAVDQALSALTASTKYSALTLAAGVGTDVNTAATLYFRVGTAQGAAATVSAWIVGWTVA